MFRSDTTITGPQQTLAARPIVLTGAFDNGSLTGSDTYMVMNGTIDGATVGGTADVRIPTAGGVSLRTLETTVAGRIGQDGVIGTFVGSDTLATVAGGFVGARR